MLLSSASFKMDISQVSPLSKMLTVGFLYLTFTEVLCDGHYLLAVIEKTEAVCVHIVCVYVCILVCY